MRNHGSLFVQGMLNLGTTEEGEILLSYSWCYTSDELCEYCLTFLLIRLDKITYLNFIGFLSSTFTLKIMLLMFFHSSTSKCFPPFDCRKSETKRCSNDCRCEQKYKWHRLLAYDPDNDCKGIFMDWFLFPSCCVCRCTPTKN